MNKGKFSEHNSGNCMVIVLVVAVLAVAVISISILYSRLAPSQISYADEGGGSVVKGNIDPMGLNNSTLTRPGSSHTEPAMLRAIYQNTLMDPLDIQEYGIDNRLDISALDISAFQVRSIWFSIGRNPQAMPVVQ